MQAHTTADLITPLALLSPSPTNPRTRMSQADIDSLAESIAAHGVMQPLLARRKPGAAHGEVPLEIVAGHRRWRACTQLAAAGRNPHGDGVPVLVHELSDAQVLAMQLVENIQREDLHPLDEAEHYRRMRENTSAPASVEDIARAGKVSPSRVYERLSLLDMVPAAREAFLAEKLSLKTALQVARMPAALQAEVTQLLSDWGGEPMSPKAAATFIRERYMLRLAQAPFDAADATLLPEAGVCGQCPKRTGANPQLFGDISDQDTCTDTNCFAAKKAAQRARLVDELRATGYQVLQDDRARQACTPDGRDLKPGMTRLEDQVPHRLGDSSLTVADVLQRAKVPTTEVLAIDHPGAPAPVVAVADAVLEGALRRLKAHREQLDHAAAKARGATKAEPTPAPKAEPAATGPTDHDDDAESDHEGTVTAADDATPVAEDDYVRELLAFKPPPTVEGRYQGASAERYAQRQEHRAFGILAAAAAGRRMRHDGAYGLPDFKLPQMICVALWWADVYVDLEQACKLAGVPLATKQTGYGPVRYDQLQTLWDLPDAQAERLAAVLLASQDVDDGSTPLRHFAECVLLGLDIAPAALQQAARDSVAQHLQLGVLANGTSEGADKPKRPAKAPAVRYRCPATGSTWSGRGLKPVWLRVALEQGAKLADFEVKA